MRFLFAVACAAVAAMFPLAPGAEGHGVAIDITVDAATGRLVVAKDYTPGEFLESGGLLFSDLPSLGVVNSANGVANGAELWLETTGGLLHWDGSQVGPAPASVAVNLFAPAAGSGEFLVEADSVPQSGLLWGAYSSSSWHADGFYFLSSGAAPGVYGLPVRLTSPDHGPSDPFVLAAEYDPAGQWDLFQVLDAAERLLDSVGTTPGDYTGDGAVDQADYLLWRSTYGSTTTLGADGNGDLVVDAADYVVWRNNLSAPVPAAPIPEPATAALFAAMAACWGGWGGVSIRTNPIDQKRT